MDAKITKQRLANLLAYDWLKILVTVAVAVLALVLLFTMTATNPTTAQTFTIYGYTDLRVGTENMALDSRLEENKVFSYDILKINSESFYGNSYSAAAYTARRAAGEGTVMFVSAWDKTGKGSKDSELFRNTGEGTYAGDDVYSGFYDPQYFLEIEIKDYLATFFGADLNGAIDEDAAAARFTARNGKDKRFRKKEQKAAGIESEKQRLIKLRDDYVALCTAFAEGKLAYVAVDKESGETAPVAFGGKCPENHYIAAFDVGKLNSISKLYYFEYTEPAEEEGGEGKAKTTGESVCLTVFRNNRKNDYDLCYETVSFLNYLAENYA